MHKKFTQGYAIIIPVLDGMESLQSLVNSLGPDIDQVLFVDSGSTDGSKEFLEKSNFSVLAIPPGSFNHGSTRERVRKSLDCDVVVYMTQDVILKSSDALMFLLEPILSGKADVAYGRQMPKSNAGFFERFPREYNYNEVRHVRSLNDVRQFGAFTFFCSDSFAAYSQSALNRVGGFEATLTHEDYFTVAKILNNGGRIAYVAEAEVIHSHDYSLRQEFRRYFDAGYVRAVTPWVTDLVGNAENHGSRYFKSLLKRLAKEDPKLLPYAFLQTLTKWLGFRIGFLCFKGPKWLKKLLSGQSYYFDSKYYIPGKN